MHKKQPVHGPQLHLKAKIRWKHFQKVSAEGLRSCSSSRGFSPQGARRLLVPSERGRITTVEEGWEKEQVPSSIQLACGSKESPRILLRMPSRSAVQ